MKKIFLVFTILFASFSFAQNKGFNENIQRKNVALVLDKLNEFAAIADFKNYFALFDEDSQFIGTDATEVWDKKQFMAYARPHFEKGKAWSFKSLKRSIYFSKDGKFAWFNELLDTQMKLCHSSGVLEKVGKDWKIRQYVLSMTVPNENVNEVVRAKSTIEDQLTKTLIK